MGLLTRASYLILILFLSGVAAWMIQEQELKEQFERARLDLLEGHYQEAEREFLKLKGSWFVSEKASAGASLSRALQGQASDLDSRVQDHLTALGFPLELLLTQALQRRQFEGLLQLAQMTPQHPSSKIFEVAALAELGRIQQATLLWAGITDHREHWLAKHLQQAFALTNRTGQVIWDRRGRLLAWRDVSGNLVGPPALDPQVLTLLEEMPPGGSLAAVGLPGNPDRKPAFSLRSSLDLDLMEVARQALNGYRGTIVLVEPASGEILAALSDKETARQPLAALRQRREPASIAKLITTSAALRWGLDPDQFLNQALCQGAKRYQGGILYCAYTAGRLHGLDRSMAISCNIGFADLAVKLGRTRLLEEYRRFGFDQGSFFGQIRVPTGNQRQLADLGIGLEATDITPLHAALLAAVVANRGKMALPVLYSATDGLLAVSPRFQKWTSEKEILSISDSQILKKAMVAVVSRGTGKALAQPDFPVAMKTGTGRDPGQGGYHINYIGFGPTNQPSLAFAVRVTNQRNSPRVRRAGVTVTRRLLAGLAGLQSTGKWPYPPALFDVPSSPYLARHPASR